MSRGVYRRRFVPPQRRVAALGHAAAPAYRVLALVRPAHALFARARFAQRRLVAPEAVVTAGHGDPLPAWIVQRRLKTAA